MAAGLATLELLRQKGAYVQLEDYSKQLEDVLTTEAERAGVAVTVNRVGSMLTVFFTEARVTDYASAQTVDTERYAKFFHAMLSRGVYLPPSQFEALFVSLAHGAGEIDVAVDAAAAAFKEPGRS